MLAEKMFAFALMGSEWVLWLLVSMSALCIAIAIERALFLRKQRSPPQQLHQAITEFLSGGTKEHFSQSLEELSGMESSILKAGLIAYDKGGVQSAEDTIAGHLVFERNRLDKGLIIIGTTGSNAPFVGLFGTVLGIIKAFNDLTLKTVEAATSVMAGISEALVATAIGLLVAIPAVILYNSFKQRNKNSIANLQSMAHLLLSRLKEKE